MHPAHCNLLSALNHCVLNFSSQFADLQISMVCMSATDGRLIGDSDAVTANSSYALATGGKYERQPPCGQDIGDSRSISVFDTMAYTMVYCGIGVVFGYVMTTPWTFLSERSQARIMPFRIGVMVGALAYSAWVVVTSLIKVI